VELKDLSSDLSKNSKHEDRLEMPPVAPLSSLAMSYDDVFQYAKDLDFGEVHFKMDAKTGLFAVVAIHSTKLGSAIGGCRCISYPSMQAAILDAIRLAHGMSYKAAICELSHGGGKAVLMKPREIKDRKAYFQSFAEFVHEMNGRYVTAIDSGTDVNDMDIIAAQTPFVTCTSKIGEGNPAPYTAIGVQRGIAAAVKFKLGEDSLKGIHVAIQGAGHVGYHLTRNLTQAGARVTLADLNAQNLTRCQKEFNVSIATPEEIYQIDCEVFAPCALGGVINAATIPSINAPIVAGSANNQLKNPLQDDQLLFERGILYVPDFLINAGGLIHAAAAYDHGDLEKAKQQIYRIYEACMTIFNRAKAENKPTGYIAQVIADERLR
jgi:leucine dehydrogenase